MGLFNNLRKAVQDLQALEEAIATRGPRRLAERVTAELQDAGPAWTGTFRNAWRINPGNDPVEAVIPGRGGTKVANPSAVVRQTVPSVGGFRRLGASVGIGSRTLYTIGNAAQHRLIAMDLEPGRGKGEDGQAVIPPNTAPQDWFTTYLQGGQFDRTVQVTLDAAIREAL